ncbi:DUF2550 domain-containing protein [uncultured Corynebacterium sp.]|uniref:DUF2550 domain-containing protein n=1 Tax=uncultured Corynebacterium sp. TaxID=159447 RepID=UPI0025D8B8A8|nr:DUF2550 domain-containing protein [uncultured Corynebacterium sp.]
MTTVGRAYRLVTTVVTLADNTDEGTWLVLWTILIIVAVCVVSFGILMAGGRFLTLRSRGIPVVVRSVPNPDGRHWRHGVLVYGGMHARVFKLRSLRPEPDISLARQGMEITGRRPITGKETSFLEPELHVLSLSDGGSRWEVALDDAGDTALVAWLESAPSTRWVRSPFPGERRRGLERR